MAQACTGKMMENFSLAGADDGDSCSPYSTATYSSASTSSSSSPSSLSYHELKEKYDSLKKEHDALVNKQTSFMAFMPYMKLAFLCTLTSLILFVIAERQSSQMLFGFFVALATVILLLSIPMTHLIGTYVYRGDYRIFQPFKGSVRFVVLQILSWCFYAITACLVFLTITYAEQSKGLLTSAGVIGLLSQIFMVSSLLTYNSKIRDKRSSIVEQGVAIFDIVDKEQVNQLVPEFVKMNSALVLIGITLSMFSEYTQELESRVAFAILGLTCIIIAVCLTHGIAGRLRYYKEGWSFVQFFGGSPKFIALQILCWSFFGLCIVASFAFIASSIFIYNTTKLSTWAYLGVFGLSAVASQAFLISSLDIFKDTRPQLTTPQNYRELPQLTATEYISTMTLLVIFCNTQFIPFIFNFVLLFMPYVIPRIFQPLLSIVTFNLIPDLVSDEQMMDKANYWLTFKQWFSVFVAISSWSMFYAVCKTQAIRGWRLALMLSLFAVMVYGYPLTQYRSSPHYPMLVFITTVHFMYISTTYLKFPENNASRTWAGVDKLIPFPAMCEKFFGVKFCITDEANAVAEKLGNPQAEEKYRHLMILAHPHGIFPICILQATFMPGFREIFPNLKVNPLTASVTHMVPVMRDLLSWFGVCDVSKLTIMNLLGMKRNLQIVCGGQKEMFESKSWDDEIVLVRKRRLGVFKIAIQKNIGLLPLFSFGETQLFDNIYMPTVQEFFKKNFGFPIPFVLLGKFYLPVARRVPISLAVDAPVFPVKQNDNPTLEEIVELQTRYFAALEKLFHKFKEENGHGGHKLSFYDD